MAIGKRELAEAALSKLNTFLVGKKSPLSGQSTPSLGQRIGNTLNNTVNRVNNAGAKVVNYLEPIERNTTRRWLGQPLEAAAIAAMSPEQRARYKPAALTAPDTKGQLLDVGKGLFNTAMLLRGVGTTSGVKTLAGLAGINTALSGFLADRQEGESVLEAGAKQTFKDLPTLAPKAGLYSITNPATDKLLRAANITKFAPKNAIIGATNVAEDFATSKLGLDPDLTASQAIASFLLPGAMDGGLRIPGKVMGAIYKGLKDSNFDVVEKALKSEKIQVDKKKLATVRKLYRDKAGRFTTVPKEVTEREIPFSYMGAQQPPIRFKDVVQNDAAYGAVAGVEPQTDDKGNVVGVKYNPQKGALGIGLAAGIKNVKDVKGAEYESVIESAKKSIGNTTEVITPLKSKWKEFYSQTVNRFQPIEDAVSAVEKKGKLKIRPEYNPTYAIKRFLGAGGTAELRHRSRLDPIINELGDIDKADFDVFLKAKRDLELAGRKIKGSDAQSATKILTALNEKYGDVASRMDDVANKLYNYQSENLSKLKDAGFLSEDSLAKIKDANKNYVPFERVMDEVDNYLGIPSKTAQQSAQPVKGIKGSDRAILSPLESIIANTYKTESAIAKNRVTSQIVGLRDVDSELADLFKPTSKSGVNTITVWKNGVKEYYEVPQEIATAVKGLDEEASNIIVDIMSVPAKILRQQATGRNIEFMIPNVFRDQLDAAINSKYGYVPFVDYFKGMYHLFRYNRGFGDGVVEAWMDSGGKMSFEAMAGRQAIRDQMIDATTQKRLATRLKDWAISGIDTIGEYSEVPTRIGLFDKAYKKTGNALIGAMESREGTLDFARMGSKMKVANSIVPFLNVGVQGFDRMIRTIKDNPRRAALALTVYGGLPAFATSLYNSLYHKEDYALVPDFVKDGNFVIMTGEYDADGNPNYISIPKGHIASLVANPTEQFVNYLFQVNPQTASQFALGFFSGPLPILGEGNTLGEIWPGTLGNLTPQIIKPPLEATANYSFFEGSEIVPPWMSSRPPELQTKKTTPETYNKIGAALNISPLKVQTVLEGYLAGGVKQPIMVSNAIEKVQRGEKLTPNEVPILRRFIGSYSGFDIDRPESGEGVDLSALLGQASAATSMPARELPTVPSKREGGDTLSGLFSKKDSLEEVSPRRLMNDVWRGRLSSGFSGDLFIYKDPNQDKPKTVDLSVFNKVPATSVARARQDDERYKLGIKLYRNTIISDEDKKRIYDKLGLDESELGYYDIASDDNTIKGIYVREQVSQITSKDRGALLKTLVQMRRLVRGEMILADSIVNDLVDDEVLSEEEGKMLKRFKFDKGGVRVKTTGRGKSAKLKNVQVNIPTSPYKIDSLPTIKTSSNNMRVPDISVPGFSADAVASPRFRVKFNL